MNKVDSDMSQEMSSGLTPSLPDDPRDHNPDPEQMTKPTRAATPAARWATSEIALLLNYTDECLRDKKVFKDTIVTRISSHSGRDLTYKGICSQISRCLLKYNQKATVKQLLQEGIKCLDISTLPGDLLSEMNRQRLNWNLGGLELEVRRTVPSSDDTASIIMAQTCVSKSCAFVCACQ